MPGKSTFNKEENQDNSAKCIKLEFIHILYYKIMKIKLKIIFYYLYLYNVNNKIPPG